MNIVKFAVRSFIAQMLIMLFITVVQSGEEVNQDLILNAIHIDDNVVSNEDINNMMSEEEKTGLFSFFDMVINIPFYLGKLITFIGKYGLSYLTLSYYIYNLGGLYSLASMVFFVWQLITLYGIFRLIFPNRVD